MSDNKVNKKLGMLTDRYGDIDFIIVSSSIFSINLSRADLNIYLYLCKVRNYKWDSTPSTELIKRNTGVKDTTFKDSIKKLMAKGLVEHTEKGFTVVGNPTDDQYTTLPYMMMSDSELTVDTIKIYLFYSMLMGRNAEAFPNKETVIKDCKICEKTYKRGIKTLTTLGYFEQGKRGYKCNSKPYGYLVSNQERILSNVSITQGMVSTIKAKELCS